MKEKKETTEKTKELTDADAATKPRAKSKPSIIAGAEIKTVPLEFAGAPDFAQTANLLQQSGFFGDYTPAQLAVLMLAGADLGFSPVASALNLEFAGGRIQLKGDLSPLFPVKDVTPVIFAPALESGAKRANAPDICPICFTQKLELTSDARDESGENVKTCSAACARQVINRRREYLQKEKAINDLQAAPAPADAADDLADNIEPAPIASLKDYVMEKDAEKAAARSDRNDAPGNESLIQTKPTMPAARAAETVESMVNGFRLDLNQMLSDLEFSEAVAAEKMAKFEAAEGLEKKRAFFDSVKKYHGEQFEKLKTLIFKTIDDPAIWLASETSRKVYFSEIKIPLTPNLWLFRHARILKQALIRDKHLEPEKRAAA